MFPWNYGFHWSTGTIIFLGAFYTVLIVIATTVANALWRSWRDMRLQKAEAIRWSSDFHDLPRRDRACRHELSGEVKDRKCPNAFDCRICDAHPRFLAAQHAADLTQLEPEIYGMPFPTDRLYHRGHTWVKPENDGTVTIGLDELGKRIVGKPDKVDLPPAGMRIHANGTAWRVERRGADVRLLSPVDGEVVATGGPDQDWYLKVKPAGGDVDVRHLLGPAEIKPWIMRELERLQLALGAGGATLADGGVPVEDIAAACPGADWDAVCGRMFLEP
jgi:glycine cleavage system H protein